MRRSIAVVLVVACGSCGGCSEETDGPVTVHRITEDAQLIHGIEATGRVGDYLLDNGQARFIVQEPGSSTGWGLFGGSLVDFEAAPGSELFEELFVQCDLRAFAPKTAEILDGTTLRLVGNDAGIPFLDAIIVRDPLEVTITVDLILPPTGQTLEIVTRVKDERKTTSREIQCGLIVLPGDEYLLTSPDRAFGASVGGESRYLGASSPDAATSYVLHRPGGDPINVVIAELGILPIAGDPVPFLANATIEERYYLSLGEKGDLATAQAERLRVVPDSEIRRDVVIDATADIAVERRSIQIFGVQERLITTANAAFGETALTLSVPSGTYDARLFYDGRQVERFDLEVPPGDTTLTVDKHVAAVGLLRVQSVSIGLDGAEEGPTPVRLRIAEEHGGSVFSGAIYQAYVPADVDVVLPEGAYTVIATRGPEHEAFVVDATVTAGERAEVAVAVVRSVDTSGWTSADLHVHGTRSADSEISRRARVLGAAAEGVDVLVGTDHDAVTDYAPTVEELGLGALLRTAPGIEMSMLYGHMNGYPVRAAEPQDHWRPGWFVYDAEGRFDRVRDPDEVAETMRSEGAKVVQINHPRDGGGVFGYLGVDDRGETTRTWPDADAAEILNGKRLEDYEEVIIDVYRLLENGRRLTGLGTSDVHSAFGVGYGRTYVRTEGDLDAVWTGIADGHAIASYGPFVDAKVETAGPGDTVVATGPVSIDVAVQAPTWMSVETIRVVENGATLLEHTIAPEDADPNNPALRFSGTFTATVTADAYYFVEVRGGNSPPLLSETVTVVNAMFVDADGDGWTYPR